MDCCPICGSDIEIVPYFDIREPLRTGYEIIHLKQNNCSVRSQQPINKAFNFDCLKGMKIIPDKSVDLILCDLPYGVLNSKNPNAKWDSVLPFSELWEQYERIIKDNGAIVLFASGMFTSDLMQSNRKLWKYNLIWKKGNRPTGFLNAKKQPLRISEDICVFYKKQPTYNPQYTIGDTCHSRGGAGNSLQKKDATAVTENLSQHPL